jgi:hypothetical protein
MREFKKFDDPSDPAMAPVYEAGGGESEGFEMAEDQLVEHASHGDDHGTTKIVNDAAELGDEGESVPDPDLYGEADSEHEDDLGR